MPSYQTSGWLQLCILPGAAPRVGTQPRLTTRYASSHAPRACNARSSPRMALAAGSAATAPARCTPLRAHLLTSTAFARLPSCRAPRKRYRCLLPPALPPCSTFSLLPGLSAVPLSGPPFIRSLVGGWFLCWVGCGLWVLVG